MTRSALLVANSRAGGGRSVLDPALEVFAAAGVAVLLVTITERKAEQRAPSVRVVDVGEDDVDAALPLVVANMMVVGLCVAYFFKGEYP